MVIIYMRIIYTYTILFRWQGGTVATLEHACEAFGFKCRLPFLDKALIDFLSQMPESWEGGSGYQQHQVSRQMDVPIEWIIQCTTKRTDSYLYDVNPSFPIQMKLSTPPLLHLFKTTLNNKNYLNIFDEEYFNMEYIQDIVSRYCNDEEIKGAELTDILSLGNLISLGHINKMLKHLYLDVITWKALPKIFQYNPSIIYVLEERDKSISFLKWVLELLGKESFFEEFFAGKLSNSIDDESVYIKAFKKTSELSLECSEIAMKKNALLSSLNEEYGRNTIKLHCTKYFQINLFDHVIKIETFKLLRQGRRGAKLLLNSPSVIDQNTLTPFYPTLDISFYNGQLNSVNRFFSPSSQRTLFNI